MLAQFRKALVLQNPERAACLVARPIPALVRAGSYLIDGTASIHDLRVQAGLPLEESSEYQTIAGFLLHTLNTVPLPRARPRGVLLDPLRRRGQVGWKRGSRAAFTRTRSES